MLRGRNESLGSRHHKDSESVFSEPSRCRGVKLIYPYFLDCRRGKRRSLSSWTSSFAPHAPRLVFLAAGLAVIASKVMAIPSRVDFLVMGAGVAGLRAAVELARHGEVLVVTKESLGESNTHYAQGGIAVATEGEADVALHLEDTVNAGDGLVYRPAAEVLVTEGPLRVAELIEWGADFDRGTANCCAPAKARTRCRAFCMPTATPRARRSAARWWHLRARTSAFGLPSGRW